MLGLMMMMCLWAVEGKRKLMKDAGYQVGSAQPELIFCPEGHPMITTGKGELAPKVWCVKDGCPHRGKVFWAALPTIELRPVVDEAEAPAGASAQPAEG
jgi:hypothetical protein